MIRVRHPSYPFDQSTREHITSLITPLDLQGPTDRHLTPFSRSLASNRHYKKTAPSDLQVFFQDDRQTSQFNRRPSRASFAPSNPRIPPDQITPIDPMPSHANRTNSFFSGPSSPSVIGLSLFHDNGRARLADDLSFLCGDIKFPVLSRAKEAMINVCNSTSKPKPAKAKKRLESTTFSSIKNVLTCRSHDIDSSFFDEKDIQQSSFRSATTVDSWKGDSTQFREKEQTKCFTKSVSSSSSEEDTSDSGHSRFSVATALPHTFDAGRISQPAIIRRRRDMLPLWINTALTRFYPSNTESRYVRHRQGIFPSSSETLDLDYSTSSIGQSGIEVAVDNLAESPRNRLDAFEVRQPRGKWNGNWI